VAWASPTWAPMIGSRLRPTRRAPTAAPPRRRSTRKRIGGLAMGHPRSECLARGSGTASVERTTGATSERRPTRSLRARRRLTSGAWRGVVVMAARSSPSRRRSIGWSPARVGDGRGDSAQRLAERCFRATEGISFGDAPIRIPFVGVPGAESDSGSDAGTCSPVETVVCGSGSGAAVVAGSDCATGGGGAGVVAATGGGVEAGGSGAGGASGVVGGWESPRGGRNSSGSTYVSASPTRMPKCT
jgi:hypothetical protein